MKLHLPKLLLTAVLAACAAVQSYAASSAPTDAATAAPDDLLWAYSSGVCTNNLPDGVAVTPEFVKNEDGTLSATHNHHAAINNINSTTAAGFTISFDLLAATVGTDSMGDWCNVLAFSTDNNEHEAQLQKAADGRLMIYAASFGGGTSSGEYSLGRLSTLEGSTLTLTYDGSTLDGYVDGILVASIAYTFGENATKSTGLTNVAFAHSSKQNGRWGHSIYNDIGIWESAMTAQEVADLTGLFTLSLNGDVTSAEAAWKKGSSDAAFTDIGSASNLLLSGVESNSTLTLTEDLTVRSLHAGSGTITIQGNNVTATYLTVQSDAKLTLGSNTTAGTLTTQGDAALTVAGNATLTASALSLSSASSITVQEKGVLDLSSISLPDDASSAYSKGIVGLINQTGGAGTVKLANSSYINTGERRIQLTFDTNFVVGTDSDAYFSLNSQFTKGSWIEHTVTNDGSITVGNGAGRFEILSGQKLKIDGGSVNVGKLSLGHSDNSVYSGAVEMTSGGLTTGTIFVQNQGADDWKNEVKLTGGTLKITGTEALTYATTARTTAIIGGSAESSLILQTGDNNWSVSKGSTEGNTLEIGNITVDAANTKMITINEALLSGTIVNNATAEGAGLTLSGDFTLTHDKFERYATTNGFNVYNKITVDHFTGSGNYVFADDMTVEGIKFSEFTQNGFVYTYDDVTTGTIYYVADAPFTIDGSDENAAKNATGYHVNKGQTLTVANAQSDTMTTDVILSTTTGEGTIDLTTTGTIDNGVETAFDGLLKVSKGGVLQVGTSSYEDSDGPGRDGATGNWTADLSSLSGVELAGGKMRFRGGSINLGNITVSAVSELNVFDQDNQNVDARQVSIGTLTLNAALDMTTKWKSNTKVSTMTGTGALTLVAANETRKVYLEDINGYSGTLTSNGTTTSLRIGKNETINSDIKLVINAGEILIDGNNDNAETAAAAQKMGTALTMGTATMNITDGSYNFAGGLKVNGGQTATVINNWDKHQFIAGLSSESAATLNWTRANQGNGGYYNYRAMVLTAKGSFAGTINLVNNSGTSTTTNEGDAAVTTRNYNYNHALVVTTDAAGALENTVVNFGSNDSSYGSTLAFTDIITNTDGTKLDGSVAGLSGDCGRVYAKALTINVAKEAEYTYGGTITADSLTKSGEGKQTLTQSFRGDVTVTGGELDVSGENAISGSTLSITNGKVTATYTAQSDKSVISKNTSVAINTDGTLHLKGHDMLGYTNAPEITLASTDSTQKATLHFEDTGSNTLGATINMNGNAQITGNKINTFGTTLSVTKTGNEVSVDTIQMRSQQKGTWDIDVAQAGELTLSSKLEDYSSSDTADIVKSGAGKLMITGTESTWSGIMKVNGGTLELVEAATLGDATVEVAAGSTLKTGTDTTIKTLTFADGAKLEADTTVKLGGVLTLGSNITLDGDLLTKVKVLTAGNTVTLFEGVTELHLGDVIYAQGSLDSASAEDLGNWFTLSDTEAVALFSDSATTIGSGYYLGYDANGTVYAGMAAIPEPTTATLSLLALAALAARRRRK